MNKKIVCKIVDNLLPNYIDELTDSEVNKFIEEHINSCKKCRNKLEEMKTEIKVEKLKSEANVDSLKKYKKIQKIKILLAILIVIAICLSIFHVYTRYYIEVDENGRWNIIDSRADYQESNMIYTIYDVKHSNKTNTKDGYIYSTIFLAINNNKCISARIIENGYDNLQQEYDTIINSNFKLYGNVKLYKDNLIYNDNYLTGKNIKEVKDIIKNKYEIINIIEL